MRDIVIVIAVGALLAAATTAVQWKIDDDRADRELRAANLTFVRDKSSPDADVPRPFNGIDLIGQNLAGLDLQKAAFTGSDLSHSNLEVTDLQDATLRDADLTDVDVEPPDRCIPRRNIRTRTPSNADHTRGIGSPQTALGGVGSSQTTSADHGSTA